MIRDEISSRRAFVEGPLTVAGIVAIGAVPIGYLAVDSSVKLGKIAEYEEETEDLRLRGFDLEPSAIYHGNVEIDLASDELFRLLPVQDPGSDRFFDEYDWDVDISHVEKLNGVDVRNATKIVVQNPLLVLGEGMDGRDTNYWIKLQSDSGYNVAFDDKALPLYVNLSPANHFVTPDGTDAVEEILWDSGRVLQKDDNVEIPAIQLNQVVITEVLPQGEKVTTPATPPDFVFELK